MEQAQKRGRQGERRRGHLFLAFVLLLLGSFALHQQATPAPLPLRLVPVASGLEKPVGIEHSGLAGDTRLFVLEQAGTIRIVRADGLVNPEPFLDLTAQIHITSWEQGLLGLAFHPQYAENGYFYVYYTDLAGESRLVRFRVRTNQPDKADPTSAELLLHVEQPEADHNGGALHFGPDGYLYLALGDGGSWGAYFNAQERRSLLGKLLRLDVDSGFPYRIPPDNPFVGEPTTRPEIWALGLRNPWRFSFDRLTGDLYLTDVGADREEEINLQVLGSAGGENYGWPCYEGGSPRFFDRCTPPLPFQAPIYRYPHMGECAAIVGGYVYRGRAFPALRGHYLFVDMCSGLFRGLKADAKGRWRVSATGQHAGSWTSFGEDGDGELYVTRYEGELYRIEVRPLWEGWLP